MITAIGYKSECMYHKKIIRLVTKINTNKIRGKMRTTSNDPLVRNCLPSDLPTLSFTTAISCHPAIKVKRALPFGFSDKVCIMSQLVGSVQIFLCAFGF